MSKLLGYEWKNSSKTFSYILTIALVICLVFQLFIKGSIEGIGAKMFDSSTATMIFTVITTLIIGISVAGAIGLSLATQISVGGILAKDLNTNRAYLTNALPVSGRKIILSKLIITLIWLAILAVSLVLWNAVLYWLLFDFKLEIISKIEWTEDLKDVVIAFGKMAIYAVISEILFIVVVHTSVLLDKIISKRKSSSYFWIFYCLIILVIYSAIGNILINPLWAQYADQTAIFPAFTNMVGPTGVITMIIGTGAAAVSGSIFNPHFFFTLGLAVLLFIVNCFLYEKKVEI